MKNNLSEVHIYIDGAARGNPGPAGWGAVLFFSDDKIIELGGASKHATNNQMELTAALEALRFCSAKNPSLVVHMHTDSTYVLKGITGWVFAWEKNGWKTKTGNPVSNRDLWEALLPLVYMYGKTNTLVWEKVSGHAGDFGNEMADTIATSFADGEMRSLYRGGKSEYEELFSESAKNKPQKKLNKSTSSKTKSSAKAYSYISQVNGIIATDKTWAECERRVKGKRGVRYKKVFSKAEEESLIKSWKHGV